MPFNCLYTPVLRSRQQELQVLREFNFEDRMYPLLEIIKLKDRANNQKAAADIWLEYIAAVQAPKVLVDLPTYLRDSPSMPDDIIAFNRGVLSNIENRIAFYRNFATQSKKTIPVISTLLPKTGEQNTITIQFDALREDFPELAIRTFSSTFEKDLPEIRQLLQNGGILIYDLDAAPPLNPLAKKHMRLLDTLPGIFKIMVRSAINNEIQNIKLEHGEVVPEADNSLLDVFKGKSYKLDAFGDYAGVKKDELSSGGTISPGLVLYDPVDNLYYGYKGEIKSLDEFADTIVPAVLGSEMIEQIHQADPDYLTAENWGYVTLQKIDTGAESGKSQAKFKRISIEHYLHCIKIMIRKSIISK